MIIAISVITRTGYNEEIRLDLGARYIRFLLYTGTKDSTPYSTCMKASRNNSFEKESQENVQGKFLSAFFLPLFCEAILLFYITG